MSGETPCVVIDTGSWQTKAGFARDNEPKGIISTQVENGDQKGAGNKPGPMEDGYISDWDAVEKIWGKIFNEILGVDPAACNVLLTDSTSNSLQNREKMAQVMFDKFNVNGLYIAKQSVLGMYSTGRATGLVVDCGHVATHVVPVYEGYCVSDGIDRSPIAGKAISDYLAKSMESKGVTFPSTGYPVFEVGKIKETMCKVAENFDAEVKSVKDQEYTLPDGQKVSIGKESLEAPELLFQPKLIDDTSEQLGVHKMIQASILKCEIDARKDLWSAITLIGGTTKLPGFAERVAKETTALHGGTTKVLSRPERANFTWIGGSVLACLPQTSWVTNKEYKDTGAKAVKKCP